MDVVNNWTVLVRRPVRTGVTLLLSVGCSSYRRVGFRSPVSIASAVGSASLPAGFCCYVNVAVFCYSLRHRHRENEKRLEQLQIERQQTTPRRLRSLLARHQHSWPSILSEALTAHESSGSLVSPNHPRDPAKTVNYTTGTANSVDSGQQLLD